MTGWGEGALGDFIELKRGYDLPARERTPGPYPILSSSGITAWHSTAKVAGPGVVTGRYGTIGEVFFIRGDFWPLNTALYVRDFKGNDPRFVSYFLRTFDFTKFVDKAAVPGVNRNDVHRARVSFPPPHEQRTIAGVLGALDDKIDLNRRLLGTLEGLAVTLFEERFGDAEEALTGELLTLSREAVDPAATPEEEFDHFSIPAFDAGRMPARQRGEAILSGKLRVPDEAVLVSKLNPRFPRVWLPQIRHRRAICSGEFFVALPRVPYTGEFLYALFRSREFQRTFKMLVTGTSTSHQRVPREAFLAIPSPRASAPEVESYTKIASPLLSRAQHALNESETLAELRDTLLPRLISGEICLREAEEVVEDVA